MRCCIWCELGVSATRGDCTLCSEYSFRPTAASLHPGTYTSWSATFIGGLLHVHSCLSFLAIVMTTVITYQLLPPYMSLDNAFSSVKPLVACPQFLPVTLSLVSGVSRQMWAWLKLPTAPKNRKCVVAPKVHCWTGSALLHRKYLVAPEVPCCTRSVLLHPKCVVSPEVNCCTGSALLQAGAAPGDPGTAESQGRGPHGLPRV